MCLGPSTALPSCTTGKTRGGRKQMQPIAQFSFLENVTFLARARVAQVVSLQPGDFAFSPLHIFIFAGTKIDGIHCADEQRDKKNWPQMV